MMQALTSSNEEVTLKAQGDGIGGGSESDGFFSDSYEAGPSRQRSTSPQKSDQQIRDSNHIPDGESDGEIKRLSNGDDDSDDSNHSISKLKLKEAASSSVIRRMNDGGQASFRTALDAINDYRGKFLRRKRPEEAAGSDSDSSGFAIQDDGATDTLSKEASQGPPLQREPSLAIARAHSIPMQRMASLGQGHDDEEQLDSFLAVLGKIKLLASCEPPPDDFGDDEAPPTSRDYSSEYYRIMKMRQALRNKEDLITHLCEQAEERDRAPDNRAGV